MCEFKINKNIILKLEKKNTNIYINGEFFNQCKFLLLETPINKIESFEDIQSIDEATEYLDSKLENKYEMEHIEISPEVIFWAHCSNLQAWYENNYNTNLLHSNLAFPLLKKLVELKDPAALRVFKEEIGKRISNGYQPVIQYLFVEGYFDYLSIDEFKTVTMNLKELNLSYCEIEVFPQCVFNIEIIEKLNLSNNNISIIPKSIFALNSLKIINLARNKIKKIPQTISRLMNLKSLDLHDNLLITLPENFSNFSSLEELNLDFNKFSTFPKIICNIKSLKKIKIGHNKINEIPNSILMLKDLELLALQGNSLVEIPDEIGDLNKLKFLSISGNKIIKIPESIKNLSDLTTLYIDNNKFIHKKSLDFLDELHKLKLLVIDQSQTKLLSNNLKKDIKKQKTYVKIIKVF